MLNLGSFLKISWTLFDTYFRNWKVMLESCHCLVFLEANSIRHGLKNLVSSYFRNNHSGPNSYYHGLPHNSSLGYLCSIYLKSSIPQPYLAKLIVEFEIHCKKKTTKLKLRILRYTNSRFYDANLGSFINELPNGSSIYS